MPKLTKKLVDAIEAGTRDSFLWDDRVKGFGVKVTPAGRRVFIYQFRMGGAEAKVKRFTIGPYGSPWTVETARDEAERLGYMVKGGDDPTLERRRTRQEAVSLEFASYVDLFTNIYLKANWPASWDEGKRVLTNHAVPYWKGMALPTIGRRDVTAVLDRLRDRPGMARLTFATLRKLFKWAVERGDIVASPMMDMTGPPVVKSRDRVLNDAELAAVLKAAGRMAKPFGPMFKLMILTGARREEAAALKWQELDLEAGVWTLPAARSKNDRAHVVPLSAGAVELLKGISPKRKGFVFSTTGTTPPSGFSKAKRQLDALAIEGLRTEGTEGRATASELVAEPFRLHDLRRTVATGLQRLGVRFEVTEAVLNHVSGSKSGVAGVYQRHDWADEKRVALDAWDRHVASLIKPKPEVGNVVVLGQRSGTERL